MRRNGGDTVLILACLTMTGCAAKTLPPSAAILEARQRAVVADSRLKCIELGAVLDLPFVFGATDLTDDARQRLDRAVAWAACTPRPQIAVTVDPEYHHRQPDKDRAMMAGRQAVLRDYLSKRLTPGVLLAEGASPDPARTLLTVRGRGW